MRKTLYTLNVDDYAPEVTRLTYPLLQRYAAKIGAEFYVITDRRWPEYAPVYDKLQIFDLAREFDDDWSIYLDSDALVHPDTPDWTMILPMDTVAHNGIDFALNRWAYDHTGVFQRSGRHIGSCNWCAIASRWCRDLWSEPDISYAECLQNIFPIQAELNSVITRDHLVDDYILSRNIARFGLKCTSLGQIMKNVGDVGVYFWHQYTATIPQKINGWDREVRVLQDVEGPDGVIRQVAKTKIEHEPGMREVLKRWGLGGD